MFVLNYLYLKCPRWPSGEVMEQLIHALGSCLPSMAKANFVPVNACSHSVTAVGTDDIGQCVLTF